MNLNIKNACKTYMIDKSGFEALKNIDLSFESGEFVSILGASGSGKTTLLNVIGGLDKLTSGAIVIDGKNTSQFTDKDWDAYRNNSVGFVFQNYHLIPHISVQRNVELGQALCGTAVAKRKENAVKQLQNMGIEDQKNKLPTLLSGGQKQRVAIARALANNPQIILADEPTGALDSKTSMQIMKILKEISKEKLVIMVTHNSEIAKKYSTRIIKLKDGEVEEDSKPLIDSVPKNQYNLRKTAMSFWQAVKLSFSNLLSKKGRTLLTSFASSIGIIGVGLVLALSNGLNTQINQFERNILTEVPVEISSSVFNFDTSSRPMETANNQAFPDIEVIKPTNSVPSSFVKTNNLTPAFWSHMATMDSSLTESMQYEYGQNMQFISYTTAGYRTFDSQRVMKQFNLTQQMMEERYEFLQGNFPTNSNQIFLVISKNNTVSNSLLLALGIGGEDGLSFENAMAAQIKLLSNNQAYTKVGEIFELNTASESLYNQSTSLFTISGIARVKQSVENEILSSGLYYFPQLSQDFLQTSVNSDVVLEQIASPTPVVENTEPFSMLNTKSNLIRKLGGDATPSKVVIYPKGYEEKDLILKHIEDYNALQEEANKITVQDFSKMLTGTIRQFTEIISIALIIFASISLIVSSIMIGIVTYISVLERTKEIGVLRALGATKGDVSRVFNAETMIIGFFAGTIGILSVFIISLPANIVLKGFIPATFGNIVLPSLSNSMMLVGLSVVLTLIAGFIPSRIASKKDPVEALRAE